MWRKKGKVCLSVSVSILLFSTFAYCQIVDGGRGRVCFALRENVAGLFGTSLEFPKFLPNYALWSLFGEVGMNFSLEDSITPAAKKELLVLAGGQLWAFSMELRGSLNAVDLFRKDRKIGWVVEGGILIPLSDRFWATFDISIGTAFSIRRNVQTSFSFGLIDRDIFSFLGIRKKQ